MRVLKPLERDGYSRSEYVAYASQVYTITSGALDNPEQVTIDMAEIPPYDWMSGGEIGHINESGVAAYQLFSFINTKFYSTQSFLEYGTQSIAVNKFSPSSSMYVFNIANEAVGDGIGPKTFSIQSNLSGNKILDDGFGRLYVNNTGSIVGNIFYKHGVVVVNNNVASSPTQSISTSGLHLELYVPLRVQFSSSATIYEHKVNCKLEPSEFDTSYFNPSLRYFNTVTGSYVSGSNTIVYTDHELNPHPRTSATASSGQALIDLFTSGTLTPYVTSIGLYNGYDLVAIAKLARPIPRTKNVPQTFVVKFDT